MTKEEAKEILKSEGLSSFNWFDDHNLRENEVGIQYKNSIWLVYITSERASIRDTFIKKFDNESDALDDFVERIKLLHEIEIYDSENI